MEEVNYIKHLNAVLAQFAKDSRLNPTHVSLYIGLFQLWNHNYFLEEFHISREEVMSYAKIGSKSTYHRCIRELTDWKYIRYIPSYNPYKGSRIKMFVFGTGTGQVLDQQRTESGTSTGQALVPKNKPVQTGKNNENRNKRKNHQSLIPISVANGCKPMGTVPDRDNLVTSRDKNYNEPL